MCRDAKGVADQLTMSYLGRINNQKNREGAKIAQRRENYRCRHQILSWTPSDSPAKRPLKRTFPGAPMFRRISVTRNIDVHIKFSHSPCRSEFSVTYDDQPKIEPMKPRYHSKVTRARQPRFKGRERQPRFAGISSPFFAAPPDGTVN
jgi:hypothetical protein